jgi:hypothetical protein
VVVNEKELLLSYDREVPEFEVIEGVKYPQSPQIRGFAPIARVTTNRRLS